MRCSGVYVALATFNGERYLREQIRSIQQQSLTDWTLLISDDGSTDGTLEIVRALAAEDSRLELLPPRSDRAGHVGNFEYLLAEALRRGGGWVFLADQDDIWEPAKLESLLALAREVEALALFSDLELIDAHGNRRGSFLHASGLAGRHDVRSLLRQNSIVGCTMLIKADLLRLALPFPQSLQNHDWWLGLCAESTGQLRFSPERLVSYRQHGGNAIGARNFRRQLSRLGSIARRQRRVFESKNIAVAELVRRLDAAGIRAPDPLRCWLGQFSGARGWGRSWRLLTSEFRPGSRELFLLQLLALSPLVGTGQDERENVR